MIQLPDQRQRTRLAGSLLVGSRLAAGDVASQLAHKYRHFTTETPEKKFRFFLYITKKGAKNYYFVELNLLSDRKLLTFFLILTNLKRKNNVRNKIKNEKKIIIHTFTETKQNVLMHF